MPEGNFFQVQEITLIVFIIYIGFGLTKQVRVWLKRKKYKLEKPENVKRQGTLFVLPIIAFFKNFFGGIVALSLLVIYVFIFVW